MQCAVVCWYSEDPIVIREYIVGVVQARRAVSLARSHQVVRGHIKWCELSSGGYVIVNEGHRCIGGGSEARRRPLAAESGSQAREVRRPLVAESRASKVMGARKSVSVKLQH